VLAESFEAAYKDSQAGRVEEVHAAQVGDDVHGALGGQVPYPLAGMRVEEVIGRQIARLRAQRQLSLTDLGQALGRYLGRPWSRQAVHQAERGQRSFTAAELTALALALDTSVQVLFRAETAQIELPGLAVSPEQYRGILLNREKDAPLDGVEEMIIALHDIGEVLSHPALARLARIGRAAEQAAGPGQP
jgi:transcriptional regulator with XRE-family HTH domain